MTVLSVLEALGGEVARRNARVKQINKIVRLNANTQEKSDTLPLLNLLQTDLEFCASIIFTNQNRLLVETYRAFNAKLLGHCFVSCASQTGLHNHLARTLKYYQNVYLPQFKCGR